MKEGRIKWFNRRKGFGFITQDNGEDIFLHISGFEKLDRSRKEFVDQPVTFDTGDRNGRTIAINVKFLESA